MVKEVVDVTGVVLLLTVGCVIIGPYKLCVFGESIALATRGSGRYVQIAGLRDMGSVAFRKHVPCALHPGLSARLLHTELESPAQPLPQIHFHVAL